MRHLRCNMKHNASLPGVPRQLGKSLASIRLPNTQRLGAVEACKCKEGQKAKKCGLRLGDLDTIPYPSPRRAQTCKRQDAGIKQRKDAQREPRRHTEHPHSLIHSLVYALTHPLTHAPTCCPTQPLTNALSHPPTFSLTGSLTHSPAHPPTNPPFQVHTHSPLRFALIEWPRRLRFFEWPHRLPYPHVFESGPFAN